MMFFIQKTKKAGLELAFSGRDSNKEIMLTAIKSSHLYNQVPKT